MFSIVIPTMLKDTEVLEKLLTELNEDSTVGEIIIIDNSCSGYRSDLSKVKVFVQKENMFVNPAWNLGIKLSSPEYRYFGVLNDDIIFARGLFKAVHDFLEKADETVGLAGIDCATNTPKAEFDTYPEDTEVSFETADKLAGFWGSAYFGVKEHYFEIPEEMKVFYGDHYLFSKNIQAGRCNYKITNIKVKHLESLSSHSSNKIKKLFRQDRKACIRHGTLDYLYLNFWQRIFSVNYFHNHYVIGLLGLKLKIRAPKKED